MKGKPHTPSNAAALPARLPRCVLISLRSLWCRVSNGRLTWGLPGRKRRRRCPADWCGWASNATPDFWGSAGSAETDQRQHGAIKPHGSWRQRSTHLAGWEKGRGEDPEEEECFQRKGGLMDRRMWIYRSFLCASLVCGLALDSNTIRSSKEAALQNAEQPVRLKFHTLETLPLLFLSFESNWGVSANASCPIICCQFILMFSDSSFLFFIIRGKKIIKNSSNDAENLR